MTEFLDPTRYQVLAGEVWAWVSTHVLAQAVLFQALVTGGVFLVALVIGRRLEPRLTARAEGLTWSERPAGRLLRSATALTWLLTALILLGVAQGVADQAGWPHHLLKTAASLLAVWVITRLTSSVLGGTVWARLIVAAVTIIAVLNILNLLDPTLTLLDALAIKLGDVRLSLLSLIKGLILLAILVRLAQVGSRVTEKKVRGVSELTPSVQVLLGKLARLTFFTIACLITLGSMGINLSAFAIFGGAVGVGLGFGLQKVFSNLVSGIILLLDRSIKPGDVIEVGSTFGRIRSLGARYVAVLTRDGTEYLIPNEDLITNRVVNWTYSDKLVRLKIPFGVSYGSDVMLARQLAVAAADSVRRVVKEPKPVCHLKGFGDNSVDLELRAWIADSENGVTNVGSEIRLAIWESFRREGIEFPFPQRDIHLKTTFPPGGWAAPSGGEQGGQG